MKDLLCCLAVFSLLSAGVVTIAAGASRAISEATAELLSAATTDSPPGV
jgi:hypothetical protein